MAPKRFTVEEASEYLFASDNESIGDDVELFERNSDNELDGEKTNVVALEETCGASEDVDENVVALEETDEAGEDVGEIQMVDCSNKRKKRDLPKVHSFDSALNEENYKRYEIIDEVTSTIDKETLTWRHLPSVISDETLYATRQQINLKTYNKSKPARYGLLYQSICSAERPYIHFTNIYAGKPQDQNSAHYISGGNFELVNKLVDGLGAFQNLKGRNISMDRLYEAIPTARHLLNKGISRPLPQ
eukprot:Seg2028.7 transcript_id=Seg2028.7/GoldUCD/mRNA.D3Y31 product="hypothetical protein" protein_id=Seg2028.7/GoldUCD/D3Y31